MSDNKPIMVRLSAPVTFTGTDGTTDEAFEAEVCCHNSKAYRKSLYFRNVFAAAFMAMARKHASESDNSEEEEKDPNIKADDSLPTIDEATVKLVLGTSDIDLETLYKKFDMIAQTGVVKVNGKAVNPKQWAQLLESPEDIDNLLVKYVANFITPLVMKVLSSDT